MLLELDAGPNEVFYAAPLFHTVEELNKAYLDETVSEQSCYVRPSKIGKLDGDAHHVAFDSKRFWVCSEPREIHGTEGSNFSRNLEDRLNSDSRRFGDEPLGQSITLVEAVLQRRRVSAAFHEDHAELPVDPRLQKLADISLQYFGAQLFVVQRRET
jgi:streptomycin 6-kinase